MNDDQAPMPPVSGLRAGPPELQENQQQIPARWVEAMNALPSQILRPLREANDKRFSLQRRSTSLDLGSYELRIYKSNSAVTGESVDDRMFRCGVENVDLSNPLQVAAFVARWGSAGQKALEKRHKRECAIGAAELLIEWLKKELQRGD